MPIVDLDWQNQLVLELQGPADKPTGVTLAVVQAIWNLNARFADYPHAQELRVVETRLACVNIALGNSAPNGDWVNGPIEQKDSQAPSAWIKLREQLMKERDALLKMLGAMIEPQTGAITAVAPQDPPLDGRADPNDDYFRGNPLRRWPRNSLLYRP